MANAAIARGNLFDSATVVARSAASLLPASNLKIADIATKWRGTLGDLEWLQMSYAAFQSADTFMFNGLGSTFLLTGTYRLRLSSDPSAITGDIWDTDVIAGAVDPKYGYLIILAPTVKSGWKNAYLEFVQTGASYIEAGRGFIGTRTSFTYNYAPGAGRKWNWNTGKTKSSGGQTKIDRASPGKYRTHEFNLGWIDEAQRWALHEELDLIEGDHTDILFISDTASANLGRDSIWGLITEVSQVTQPFTIGDLYSRSMPIEERL